MDRGLRFLMDKVVEALETGKCELCHKVVPVEEIMRNEGICKNCAIHGEIK